MTRIIFLSEFQLYYAVGRCSNRDVQNKNLAYIENHKTPPPLFWAVPGGDPKCKSPRKLVLLCSSFSFSARASLCFYIQIRLISVFLLLTSRRSIYYSLYSLIGYMYLLSINVI